MFAPQPIANEGNTPEPAGQENLRRQQIMRFGLIICLLFLILDNGSQVSNPTPSGPRTNSWHTEIPLGDQYGVKIQSILSHQSQNIQNIVQKPINSTGLFRGPWNVVSKQNNVTQEYSTTDGSVLVQLVSVPVRNLPDLTFVYGLLHLYKNPELDGRAHQQVKQDVGFPVQGVVVSSQRKMVVFSTPFRSQRLYVRLASKHHFGNFTGLKPSHGRSGRRRLLADALDASLTGHDGHEVVEIEPGESGHSEGDALVFGSHTAPELFDFHPHSSANPISSSQVQQYSLSVVRTLLSAVGGERARSGAERNQGSSGHRALSGDVSSGVGSDANGGALSMRVLGLGDARQTSSGNNNEVLLTELTDAGFLSVMLADQPLTVPKAASPGASNQTQQQQQQPKSGEGVNETAPPASPTRVAAAVGKNKTEGEFLVSIALGETVLPGKFKALQSTALPPSLRQHLVGGAPVQWGNATQTTVPVAGVPAQQECQYLGQLGVETRSSRAERSGAAGGSSDLSQAVDFAEQGEGEGGAVETVGSVMMGASAPPERDAPPPAAATAVANASSSSSSKTSPAPVPVKLEPALALTGTLSSGDCGKTITFEATAFHIEFNALKVKVELYALVASMLSLVQVFLVIYQINYCSTQAQASKVSLVSLFGQSLLDANLCMAHLLLSFAFPTVFFASFIWICVLKMLLFSVLQMRFIINTYQARYAQELAAEGFNGIRRRLIGLHAGFYGVLLVVLLVSIAFYKRPVVAVFAMYSFWLPQVVYSAYMGTKHSFHPLYLVGVSLCHLFIPLYILGCPNNFLGLLSVYTNPHYLAEIAGEHGAHAQDLHHLSLSSVSACWVLVVWMTFQVGMLLLQTALGPRFFVPKKWLPSRYDYKRPVPDTLRAAFPASNGSGSGHSTPRGSGSGRNESLGDIAMTGIRSRSSASSSSSTRASSTSGYGGLQALFGYGRSSSGAAGNDSEEDMETGRLLGDGGGSSGGGVAGSGSNASPSATSGESNPGGMDCAICCNLIHFNSRDNLITPCDHVFHEECLERWTHVKLECPVCRSALPSLGED